MNRYFVTFLSLTLFASQAFACNCQDKLNSVNQLQENTQKKMVGKS